MTQRFFLPVVCPEVANPYYLDRQRFAAVSPLFKVSNSTRKLLRLKRTVNTVAMLKDIILVCGGVLLLILIMALVLNPPEAFIKRVFRRRSRE